MAPALPDDLSKLTVAKLKDALKKRGLDVAGLKADLVARLQSAVDAENKAGPGSPKSPPTSKSPRQSKGAGDEDGKSPRTSTREPSPERKSPRASGGKGECVDNDAAVEAATKASENKMDDFITSCKPDKPTV